MQERIVIRKLHVRCETFMRTDSPVVELDEEEESILNVNHEGGTWWVYIARWVDEEVPFGPGGHFAENCVDSDCPTHGTEAAEKATDD